MKQIITLTSDFGVQSQGIGIMEGTIVDICPEARVIHLMHGLPDYDITVAARTMETIKYMPIGYHVCVVDPGVGTKRKGIIIKTKRGDYFIGPDNGVFMSAIRFFGFEKAVVLENPKYMRQPVSPIFHGRDVFSPAAAHLANGIKIEEFGEEIKEEDLVKAPYEEAILIKDTIKAKVIHINKYGSPNINITHEMMDEFAIKKKSVVKLIFKNKKIDLPYVDTFGEVDEGKELILKDDYGRVEIAINLGNFAEKYNIKIGDEVIVEKN